MSNKGRLDFVACSLLAWIPILPFTQSEQELRWTAERAIRSGQWNEIAALSNKHEPSKFPNHWDAPPRVGYGERSPKIHDVINGLQKEKAADWLIDAYAEKLEQQSDDFFFPSAVSHRYTDEELRAFVEAISSLPNGKQIAVNTIGGRSLDLIEDVSDERAGLFSALQSLAGDSKEESED